MNCPRCDGKTMVRQCYKREDHVKRERICTKCGLHFFTVEVDEDMAKTLYRGLDMDG